MSDDRCHAVNPTRGLPCTRSAAACNGIDHTARTESGVEIFWPSEGGTTQMHRYFDEWWVAKQKVIEEAEKENMESTNENSGA